MILAALTGCNSVPEDIDNEISLSDVEVENNFASTEYFDFEFASDWEISEGEGMVEIQNPNEKLGKSTSLCGIESPTVEFQIVDGDDSKDIKENIAYDENGGLGVFGGDLEELDLGGRKALSGLFGDQCGGTDYFVELGAGKYVNILIPELTNGSTNDVNIVLDSIKFY